MQTPPEDTAVKLTLSGARITLAAHPLDPARPGCLLSVLAEGLLLVGLVGLHALGVGWAWAAALGLLTLTGVLMWPVAGTLLVHLLSRWAGRPGVRLRLTAAALIRSKPAPLEILLEDIAAVEELREGGRLLQPWAVEVVLRDGARERVGWAMRADEARWLAAELREAAARRRAALAAEGHVLSEAPSVPAPLRGIQERTR